MYYPGQIVHDLEHNRPFQIGDIWSPTGYPRRHTHYVKWARDGLRAEQVDGHWTMHVVCFLPASIKEAEELLYKGIIVPAPKPPDHYWLCGNWLSNHNTGNCNCQDLQDLDWRAA
jgi:hypothetical protein